MAGVTVADLDINVLQQGILQLHFQFKKVSRTDTSLGILALIKIIDILPEVSQMHRRAPSIGESINTTEHALQLSDQLGVVQPLPQH